MSIYSINKLGVKTSIPSLEMAANGASYSGCEIHITSSYTLSSDIVFPSDRVISLDKFGVLVGSPSVSVTFQGGFKATLDQHFSGGLLVLGLPGNIQYQWWGEEPPTFTIYVSNALNGGNDLNNGLSEDAPKETIQAAIDYLAEQPYLKGNWVIQLSAGIYSRARFPDNGLWSENPIVLKGPDVGGHPNVPTAIIREAETQVGFGVLLSQGTKVKIQDIKIEDYNGSTSSCGIRANTRSDITTQNVHIEDCYYGLCGVGFVRLDVKGGIFNDNGYLLSDIASPSGYAIRGLFHCKFEIGTQSAGTLDYGPFIKNCAGALRGQELCTGHLDWVTIEDCSSGIRLLVNSRLNIDGSSFKRITNSAVYATQGCHVDPTFNTIFGTGVDINGADYTIGQGSTASTAIDGSTNTGNGANLICIKSLFPNDVITSTSSANVIHSLDLKKGVFSSVPFSAIPSKKITYNIKGELTGTTGTYKRILVRLGSLPIVTLSFGQTEVGLFEAVIEVFFKAPSDQFYSVKGLLNNSTCKLYRALSSIDMSVDQTLAINGYVNNSSDSIIISSYEVFTSGI